MAADLERLVVSLEARTTQFEKSLARVEARSAKSMAAVSKSMAQASERADAAFARMAMTVARIGAPLAVAGAGLAAAGNYVRNVARDVANLAAEAKRAGVAVEAFQELKYAAEQSGVGLDGLTDGLKELQLRADEFIATGAGSGAEAFQRLGYSADDLKTKLKDPAALFQEIIERLRDLNTAAQIRVSDELFGGTGGEQFVRFLEQGRNGIERLRNEARSVGAVIDEGLVKQAIEVDRRFKALATTVDTNVKGAVLGLIDALRSFSAAFMQAVNTSTSEAPSALMAKYQQEAAGIRAQIDEARKTSNMAVVGDLERRLADAERRAANLSEAVREASRAAAVSGTGAPLPPNGAPLPPSRPQGLGGGGIDVEGMKAAAKAAANLATAYEGITKSAAQRVADAQIELQTMGMSTTAAAAYRMEMELINEATRAGISLTPQQTEQLKGLAAQYGKVTGEIEKANEAQQRLNEIHGLANGFFSDLRSGLKGGKDLADSFADAVGNLTEKLLDMLTSKLIMQLLTSFLMPGSSGASIGLFSGGGMVRAATGGSIRGAGTGTSDSIPAMLSNGEYVVNAKAAARNRALLERINNGTAIPGFAMGGSAGGPVPRGPGMGGNVVVNVHNNGGAEIETRQSSVGNSTQIDLFVEKKINSAIASGKVDKSMRARYGLGTSSTRRG